MDGLDHTSARASYPLVASEHTSDGKYHLLLAASGSVATIKIPNIIKALEPHSNLSIRVVLTDSAARFLQGQSEEQPSLEAISKYRNVDAIYRDHDEWDIPWTRGAPILHIELRRWADVMFITPLSANTLAEISGGFCNTLLTSVVRAWRVETDPITGGATGSKQKRIFVAPAMNTAMWQHPATKEHLSRLGTGHLYHWFTVLRPVEKELACGDTGDGAMCDWRNIVAEIKKCP